MVPCESHGTIQTVHTTYAGALRTTTHLQTATLTSSAPDDGRMRPKHVELRKLQQINCCIKLAFHFISCL